MNNSSKSKYLLTLKHWLWRSIACTVICVVGCGAFWHYAVDKTLAFAPGLGALSLTKEGIQARSLTVLATAVVLTASLTFALFAVYGFKPAYQRASEQKASRLNRAACAWWAIIKVIMFGWLICDALVVLGCVLSLSDEGGSWN